MDISSPRFKAVAVSAGFSLWFFIITSALGVFSIPIFVAFIIGIFALTQILAKKISKALDIFATVNTKIFLGILYVTVFYLYGILFKILRIDLLRLKIKSDTYWLEMEQLKESRILKQY